MDKSSPKRSMNNRAGSTTNSTTDREITIFESPSPAIEEAEFCAEQNNEAYCIIQFGGFFGVVAKKLIIKDDIVYETVNPTHKHSIY